MLKGIKVSSLTALHCLHEARVERDEYQSLFTEPSGVFRGGEVQCRLGDTIASEGGDVRVQRHFVSAERRRNDDAFLRGTSLEEREECVYRMDYSQDICFELKARCQVVSRRVLKV